MGMNFLRILQDWMNLCNIMLLAPIFDTTKSKRVQVTNAASYAKGCRAINQESQPEDERLHLVSKLSKIGFVSYILSSVYVESK